VTLTALKASTHAVLDPEQWSAASLSQTPPCAEPVHSVEPLWNVSEGHVDVVPEQVSATSHCPADPRHVKLAAWKTSTHVLADPEQ
jgi:hypothetical protein